MAGSDMTDPGSGNAGGVPQRERSGASSGLAPDGGAQSAAPGTHGTAGSLSLDDHESWSVAINAPLFNALLDPVWITDTKGQCRFVNRAWLLFTGRRLEQERGDGWIYNIHPDERSGWAADFEDAMKARRPFRMEARLRQRAGGYRWIACRAMPFNGLDGRFAGYIGQCNRIAARDRHIQCLGQCEEKFLEIFRCTPNTVAISTISGGRFIDVNPATERLLGYSREEMIGRSSLDLGMWHDPGDRQTIRQLLDTEGRIASREVILRRKDGVQVTCLFAAERIVVGGRPCMLSFVRDITERKEIEQRVAAALTEQELIFENLVVGVAFLKERRFARINGRLADMFGYRQEEMVGSETRFLYFNDEGFRDLGHRAYPEMAEGRHFHGEQQFRHKDGRPVWCRVVGRALDPADPEKGSIWILEDITAHRRAQQDLQKIMRAIEQSPVSIMITDTNGIIEYVNPRFTETSGYTAEEMIGQTPRLLKSPQTRIEEYQILWRTILSGQVWRGRLLNQKKGGALYWEDVTIAPVRDGSGEVTHFVSVKEDVTERMHAEQELRWAKEQADLANRAKSQFLANMSHELRTPLNVIIGFAELIKDQAFGPVGIDRYVEYAGDIYASGHHLLSLLTDILDIAKIEAGKVRLDRRRIDLKVLLESSLRLFTGPAIEKNLSLELQARDGVVLFADERAVKQIVFNLVSNAIKFTEPGGRVTVAMTRDPDGSVTIQVADTGIGIPRDQIKRVLQPFVQVADGYSRSTGGTGLGLSLVQGLLHLHGGEIRIDSEVGVGTVVTVWFPPVSATELLTDLAP